MVGFRLVRTSADAPLLAPVSRPQGRDADPGVDVGQRFNSLKERNPLAREEKVSLLGVIVGAVLCGLVAWVVHRQVQLWRARRRAEALEAERRERERQRRKALGLAPPRVFSLREGPAALMQRSTPRDLLRVKLPGPVVVFDGREESVLCEATLERVVVPGFQLALPGGAASAPRGAVFLARREAGGEVSVYPVDLEPPHEEHGNAVAAGRLDLRSPALRFLRHGRQECRLRATLLVRDGGRTEPRPHPLDVLEVGLHTVVAGGLHPLEEGEEADLLIAFPQALEASRFRARLAPRDVADPDAPGHRFVIEPVSDLDLLEAGRFLALRNMEVNEDGGDEETASSRPRPAAARR